MLLRSPRTILAIAAAIALGIASSGAWAWLRHQYTAHDQIELAERFVSLLKSKQLADAYELTMKTRMELPTKEEFAEFAPRQICGSLKIIEVFPFQSNGNRLRRWITGQKVEMPELNVQYMGDCAFRITVRRDTGGKLKIFKFGSHAY